MAIKKKFRHLSTDITIVMQEDEELMLSQSDSLYPLSGYFIDGYDIVSITNCSYFNDKYVNGRNQGDLKNDTYNDAENGKWCDLIFFKDGTWKAGKFNSWDYREDVVAGFSPVVLKLNGEMLYSDTIKGGKSRMIERSQHTAICITRNNKVIQVVSEGRTKEDFGLTGNELFKFLESMYDLQVIALLDGGGSSEMIYNGKIITDLEGGKERPMLNGLALVKKKESPKQIEILFPCADGWISQGFHSKHMAIDIGWLSSQSKDGKTSILACADGTVEFEGYYKETISGKVYEPIVCIIKHDNFDNKYTYYSIYWHLSRTVVNVGDIVKAGTKVGLRGSTGHSTGVHLHFALLRCPKGAPCPKSYQFNNYAVNPLDYMYRTEDQVYKIVDGYDIHLKKIDNVEKPLEPNKPCEECEVLKEENDLLQAQVKRLEKINNDLDEKVKVLSSKIDSISNHINAVNDVLKK